MDGTATYKRTFDSDDEFIKDTVEIEINANTQEGKMMCLKAMNLLHEVLEEYEVFKKRS